MRGLCTYYYSLTIFEQISVEESNFQVLMKISNASEMNKSPQNQEMPFSLLLIERTGSGRETCFLLRANSECQRLRAASVCPTLKQPRKNGQNNILLSTVTWDTFFLFSCLHENKIYQIEHFPAVQLTISR